MKERGKFVNNLKKDYGHFIEVLDESLEKNKITQYEYNEYKTMNLEYDEEREPIELFKELYSERQPIKCSMLLLNVYDVHQNGFRNAVLLENCFPSPFSHSYNQETHDFTISIIGNTLSLAKKGEYSKQFIDELEQLYLAFTFFHHNNLLNIKKLNESKFMEYSLSEQIRMFSIYLQEQSRLREVIDKKNINEKGFVTGMEGNVSDQKTHNDVLISFEDNFETSLEIFDTLIRYLYFKKKKDFKKNIIPKHGDITYVMIPSFEEIIYVSNQRSMLINLWEKFVYSQWNITLNKKNEQHIFTFAPKFKEEHKELVIANFRRQYSLMGNIFENLEQHTQKKVELSSQLNKNKIETLFLISKEEYFQLIERYQTVVDSYKLSMHPYYLNLTLNELKMEDIFKVFKLLNVFAERYKEAIYKDFNEDYDAWHKYLSPIIPIKYFIQSLINFYDFSTEYSKRLINSFVFDPSIKGESDIFSRPLILINNENIIFCPVLIQQMNLGRIVEILISNSKVNISQIGIDFENKMRSILSSISGIAVNTNKVEFFASDKRDVEFDFIGMFNDHLILVEFKAMTTPYSDKEYKNRKKIVFEGVEQINRRNRLVKSDWNKIKELVNIELPEEPVSSDKIIKLLVTNIFDFTTLIYEENVRVVDESTFLKFFVSPTVEMKNIGKSNILYSKKIWKNSEPTVIEFKEYLENPITTFPYKQCMEEESRKFLSFKGEYPFELVDQILIKDPIEYMKTTFVNTERKATLDKKRKKRKRDNKRNKKKYKRKK